MASMTIRNLDDGLKARLRLQAALHNRSMEEEARYILRAALSSQGNSHLNLAESIKNRLDDTGGVDLEIAARDPIRTPPDLL